MVACPTAVSSQQSKGDERLQRVTTTTAAALLQLLRLPSGASVVAR
jgi:hypothetical protein